MRLLSPSEAEELMEHLRTRPDIWIPLASPRAFARKVGTEQYGCAIALKPQAYCFVLSAKSLVWEARTTEEYITWLLDKYTAYSNRLQLLTALEGRLKPSEDIVELSIKLAELRGEHFQRRFERREQRAVEFEETTA